MTAALHPPPAARAAQRARASASAQETRETVKRELEQIASLDRPAAARRAAEILEDRATWSQALKLQRLLEAIPGVGDIKVRTLTAAARVDAALACRDAGHAKTRAVAVELRRYADRLAENAPPAGAAKRTTSSRPAATPTNHGLARANRVRLAQVAELRVISQAESQRAGALRAAVLLRSRAGDPDLRSLKVIRIARAIPGVGARSGEALLGELGLAVSARLGGLPAATVGALASRIANTATLSLPPGATKFDVPDVPPPDATAPPIIGRLLGLYTDPDGQPHAVTLDRRGYATVIVDYALSGVNEIAYLDPAAALDDIARAAATHTAAQQQLEVAADRPGWAARDGRLLHVYTSCDGDRQCVIVQRREYWDLVVDYGPRRAVTLEVLPAGPRSTREIAGVADDYVAEQRRAPRAA